MERVECDGREKEEREDVRVLGRVVERLGWSKAVGGSNESGDVGVVAYDAEKITMCVRRLRLWRCLLRMEEW